MFFKRIYAAALCICLLLSIGQIDRMPVYAADTQDNQVEELVTEPQETEPQETEPLVTEPPATELSATEPYETQLPTIEATITEPLETVPVDMEIQTTEPIVTVPTDLAVKNISQENEVQLSELIPDASVQDDDLRTVSGQGITFRLFNYSTDINKTAGNAAWRAITPYFTFRNSRMENGLDAVSFNVPSPASNAEHDQDGYTKSHATVERTLDGGYPVLDLTRNADGSDRTNPGISTDTRSLRYLFSSGDHAVTAYTPSNTILQQSGSHYWYNSADHAVDYDLSDDRFRLRSYVERNSVTAGYGSTYGDFLPFTYTGGIQQGNTEDGIPYHVDTEETDYWFGMTMQVDFLQTKAGKVGNQDMIFRFSGDDDVWVFVDNVLVLDLGGTHGTVSGSINFATGEVLQYLNWDGSNRTEAERTSGSNTSFPTTIRACFDAAGRTPNGGWSKDGQTFSDFSEHTLKFFYLERGAAVANCSLDFRLPTLPDESLTVTKDLVADVDSELRDFISDSLRYRFRVLKSDGEGKASDEPFILEGMTYSLLENGVKTGTGTVEEDNCFSLRAGQSAQFTQMLQKGNGSAEYLIEELMPDNLAGQYAGVEYLVSGVGGETITGNNPAEQFTTFQTGILLADQTQTVTFRNRVDTGKLGLLKISKRAADGTQIPEDLFFQIQVKLGGKLIPVGTPYHVGNERRSVETEGVLLLRVNETAVLEQGILAGTSYQVTELSAAFDGYRPAYTGVVQPAAEVYCDEDGASGEFPLAATVHITITNADYDFAIKVPVCKKILDFRESGTFTFEIEQVENIDNGWKTVKTLPELKITVDDANPIEEDLTIGYRSHDEGVYYYRIREKEEAGNFLYDTAIFLVEVTVGDGSAEITGIQKNGVAAEAVIFVNRRITNLTITKTIVGGTGDRKFSFTVEIYLNDEPFLIPESINGQDYRVEENTVSFMLGHGESITLPCIPLDAVVKVEEHDNAGFLVFTELDCDGESKTSGAIREIRFDSEPKTIHFTNQSGFRLPNTGGMGTALHAAGGTVTSLGSGAALIYMIIRKGRRKAAPDA